MATPRKRRGPQHLVLDDTELRQIAEERRAQLTYDEIARKHFMTWPTLRNALHRQGVPLTSLDRRFKRTDEMTEKIVRLYRECGSCNAAAKQAGISGKTARVMLISRGIHIKTLEERRNERAK